MFTFAACPGQSVGKVRFAGHGIFAGYGFAIHKANVALGGASPLAYPINIIDTSLAAC